MHAAPQTFGEVREDVQARRRRGARARAAHYGRIPRPGSAWPVARATHRGEPLRSQAIEEMLLSERLNGPERRQPFDGAGRANRSATFAFRSPGWRRGYPSRSQVSGSSTTWSRSASAWAAELRTARSTNSVSDRLATCAAALIRPSSVADRRRWSRSWRVSVGLDITLVHVHPPHPTTLGRAPSSPEETPEHLTKAP